VTTIRVSCPTCGAVDLTPEQVCLRLVRAGGTDVGPDSHYTFTCPSCLCPVAKRADERVAQILRSGGVGVELVGDLHPEDPPAGDPLTYDDLLDFHVLLQDDDWFGRLARSNR
jgi:hypothetical protein